MLKKKFRWLDVATIASAKGIKGDLLIEKDGSLPFLLSDGDEVCIVPPQTDIARRLHIARIRPQDERCAVVRFDEIGDVDIAKAIVGCHCLIKDNGQFGDIECASEDGHFIGFAVEDEIRGFIGHVVDAAINFDQVLLNVKDADGHIHLIPLVDEFVIDMDDEASVLRLRCPNGLLDL